MTPIAVAIGDIVEVLCDHKRGGRRIRDWVEGVVVHADDRMTAIQFRTDVYLTDGWMVPDRILWFNKGTAKIRLAKKGKSAATSGISKKASPPRKKQTPSKARKPPAVLRKSKPSKIRRRG
ncbi:MAG: hypothetical protein JW929_11820 [Anaerolineales bacterium]|nr:hypothetical protein [Anaerolineales bacterium]